MALLGGPTGVLVQPGGSTGRWSILRVGNVSWNPHPDTPIPWGRWRSHVWGPPTPRGCPSLGDTRCSVQSRGGAVAGLGPCKQAALCRAQPRRWFRFLGALPRAGGGHKQSPAQPHVAAAPQPQLRRGVVGCDTVPQTPPCPAPALISTLPAPPGAPQSKIEDPPPKPRPPLGLVSPPVTGQPPQPLVHTLVWPWHLPGSPWHPVWPRPPQTPRSVAKAPAGHTSPVPGLVPGTGAGPVPELARGFSGEVLFPRFSAFSPVAKNPPSSQRWPRGHGCVCHR